MIVPEQPSLERVADWAGSRIEIVSANGRARYCRLRRRRHHDFRPFEAARVTHDFLVRIALHVSLGPAFKLHSARQGKKG
jgi:hypothetical protein